MTRILSWLLLLAVSVVFVGCGGAGGDPVPPTNPTAAPDKSVKLDDAGANESKKAIK